MKHLIILVVVVVLGLFLYTVIMSDSKDMDIYSHTVTIGDAVFSVGIADSGKEREKGLMFVENLPEKNGMVFIYNIPISATFWNKNTLIPLDIIWIRDNKVVGTSSLPAQKGDEIIKTSSNERVDMVIELNRGAVERNGIKVGDAVLLKTN